MTNTLERISENKLLPENKMEKFQWSLKNGEIEDVKRFVEEDGVDVDMVRDGTLNKCSC